MMVPPLRISTLLVTCCLSVLFSLNHLCQSTSVEGESSVENESLLASRSGQQQKSSSGSGFSDCSKLCSCLGGFVDCSGLGLKSVPSDIPSWVEVLDLSRNHIRNLPNGVLKGLSLLKKVDLSHNKLRRIEPFAFGNYSDNLNGATTTITTTTTPSARIYTSPSPSSTSSSWSSLEELNLNHNRLTSFPYLPNLTNLTTLSLRHNKIRTIVNTSSTSYVNLQSLDLSYNHLQVISPSFLILPKLKTLQLINSSIVSIEKTAFENLTSLETLRLCKNHLEKLPKDLFRSLNQLRELDLSRNSLTQIDGLAFYGLENLHILKIKKNKLSQLLDGAFWELRNIKFLHLDQNNLTAIKKGWLYGLASLKQLNISHNAVHHIDGDGWEFCRNLWELDLSHNDLHSIKKDTFSRLLALQYLFISHNKISFIEEGSLKALTSLQVLDLSHNEISWVIEDTTGLFIGLERLEQLNLAQNYIKSVTKAAFSGLPRLRTLNLMFNPVTAVENGTFSTIKNLDELHFDSDHLLCDCQIKWFAEWLRSKPAVSDLIINAKCKHPVWLAGQRLLLVEVKDLKCDDFPKPYIIEDPKTQMALKGANTTLACKAATSSSAQMSFEWRKDNKVIDLSVDGKNYEQSFAHSQNGSITEYISRLYIVNTTDEDSGKYQCVVANPFGTVYSQKAMITVNVLPIFTKQPMNITVAVGSTARLECAAKGHPAPEIAWKKDGGDDFPAARERRMHVMPSDDVFFIVEVKSSDSGLYTCTAHNDAGAVTVNASLVVLETPTVARKMKDKEAKIGETAVLQCKATGNPKPVLTWSKDDKSIVSTERHFFTLDNQLLIIVDVQAGDEGKYSCEMNNIVGTAKDSTYLKVFTGDAPPVTVSNSPPTPVSTWNWVLTDHQTIGFIIIAVVFCVVVTSLIWVIIIYKTRKRSEEF